MSGAARGGCGHLLVHVEETYPEESGHFPGNPCEGNPLASCLAAAWPRVVKCREFGAFGLLKMKVVNIKKEQPWC